MLKLPNCERENNPKKPHPSEVFYNCWQNTSPTWGPPSPRKQPLAFKWHINQSTIQRKPTTNIGGGKKKKMK